MSSQLEQGYQYIILSEFDSNNPISRDGPLYWEVCGKQDKYDALDVTNRFGSHYGKITICQLKPIGTPDEVRDKLQKETIKFADNYVPVFERDTPSPFDSTGCFMPEIYQKKTALYDVLEFIKNFKHAYGECLICEVVPIGTPQECKKLWFSTQF